jgi:hypothetical protein
MDAPLGVRLQSFRDDVRALNPNSASSITWSRA